MAYCYNVVALSVYVCVCLSVGYICEPCKKTAELMVMQFGGATQFTWAQGTIILWGLDPYGYGKRHFLGVVKSIEKQWESLLWCCSKRDHLFLSNCMACDAAYCQNSLTTFQSFFCS